jgi:hypothetical protein
MGVLVLSCIPFMAWLALVLLALVTLRFGPRRGLYVLIAALVGHCAVLFGRLSLVEAVLSTCSIFVPTYIAAVVLHLTTSWRLVFAAFALQLFFTAFVVENVAPNFITAQYSYIKSVITDAAHLDNSMLATMFNQADDLLQRFMADYLFGLQLSSMLLVALFAMLTSRFLQAKMYYPQGFHQELLTIRGDFKDLIVFLLTVSGSLLKWHFMVAGLPSVVLYFAFLGVLVSAALLVQKKIRFVFFILLLPVALLPVAVVFFTYAVLGLFFSSYYGLKTLSILKS